MFIREIATAPVIWISHFSEKQLSYINNII
jgi:hypothetical protein